MRNFERGFVFIVGNMFGSKTSEMIHLLNLEKDMGRNVQAFKMSFDNRYKAGSLLTHSGMAFPAKQVKSPLHLESLLKKETQVVGIEEVQFFDERIIDFILENKEKYLTETEVLYHLQSIKHF